ncbi:MAG: hypothetical protein U9Q99_02655 [Nanoarchaeota archaeon]|nr:hypothetical protein [Nanoarchaeota archaeon]
MNHITNKLKEYSSIYEGEEVIASDGNRTFQGIFIKIEDGIVYLKPSIVFENIPINKPGEWEFKPVWNEETPTTFPLTQNMGFQAYNKGYLQKLIKNYSRWTNNSKEQKSTN